MMIKQYSCPGCGSNMSYDPALGKLSCGHCGHSEDVVMDNEEDLGAALGNDGKSYEYHCPNCGSVLIAEEKVCSVTCEYCDTPLILADRLSGNYRPQKIIPFKIDKKAAIAAFKKSCNGTFAPSAFIKPKHLNEIRGMYVPYWLFNMKARVILSGTAIREKVSRRGDTEITTISHYRVYREGELSFANVPYDASEKMPDDEMARLEPFDFSEVKTFAMPYLTGFDSSQYDYDKEQIFKTAANDLTKEAIKCIKGTIPSYKTLELPVQNVKFTSTENTYTLLPVWTLSTVYKGKKYQFMMNGQTGRVVGRGPLAKSKLLLLGGIVSAALYIMMLTMG